MATSIPSASNRIFWGVNVSISVWSGAAGLNSGNVFAGFGTVKTKWGYKIFEEKVVGQSTPYLGTGVLHGELDIECLGSSDNRFESIMTVTSGIVAGYNVQWRETDTQTTMSGRVWTVSGVKFTDMEHLWDRDMVIKYKIKGIMPLEPVVS